MNVADSSPDLRNHEWKSASCLFAYWRDGDLRIVNYLTRRTFSVKPIALEVIGFFSTPRTIQAALVEFGSYSGQSVGRTILKLIDGGLLLESGSVEEQNDRRVESEWKPWLPGGAFHFLTKDERYIGGDWTREQRLRVLPKTPAPPQFKSIDGAERFALPVHETGSDGFFDTLHARRTHRSFSKAKMSLEDVSRLLQTTWGVQGYFESEEFGRLPYKTSPSGGARHPIEAYLMALRVQGLEIATYHYHPRDHLLEKMSSASPAMARAYCADQPYAAEVAALFIMTGVFGRTMWKYFRARAYRVVLLDAGHLAQTFCLTATRMGLAPFTTAALKDTLIENDLGIDGVSESVLYVVGVGAAAD